MNPPGDADLRVRTRRALLDALEALAEQLEAIVVIGAQAVYMRTREIEVAIPEETKDADLCVDARALKDDPKLEQALEKAGFHNTHIRSICTTARFAAGRCPAGSIYGHAKAWTLLLDRPLEGPVYLRSSSNWLPDLVASLNGQIHLDLTAHVSSARGRLRYTFAALPDAPLSKLALTMRGGRKGLLVNTGGLCAGRLRASASLIAHNSKALDLAPVLQTDCEKAGTAAKG
jgi:hypothetical protein